MKVTLIFFAALFVYITQAQICRDRGNSYYCRDIQRKRLCGWQRYRAYCQKTCGACGGVTPTDGPVGPIGPTNGNCGVSSFQAGRVIAGTTARPGAWPWQILMKANGRAGCGGSLISANWVLTAAHCITGGRYSVVLGEHDRNRREGHEQEISVSRAITHPRWNRRTFEYDFALLRLSKPAQMNKYVQPVCLPTGDARTGQNCYITGWGRTNGEGRTGMSTILQQAPMQVVDQRTCHAKNYRAIRIPIKSSMICGGGRGRISGCQGDSGGPFVCNEGGKYVLHGDVSHGSKNCRSRETYTVFGRINYVRQWIRQTANV